MLDSAQELKTQVINARDLSLAKHCSYGLLCLNFAGTSNPDSPNRLSAASSSHLKSSATDNAGFGWVRLPDTDLAHEFGLVNRFAGSRFACFSVLRQIYCSKGSFAQHLPNPMRPLLIPSVLKSPNRLTEFHFQSVQQRAFLNDPAYYQPWLRISIKGTCLAKAIIIVKLSIACFPKDFPSCGRHFRGRLGRAGGFGARHTRSENCRQGSQVRTPHSAE